MDASTFSKSWTRFKSELPHQRAPMAARNWGNPLHSLCSYQGKLKPSIARLLVEAFVPEGGRVLDPFAGVGTIPFEACLTGRAGLGLEISPSAMSICDAKLHQHSAAAVEDVLIRLERGLSVYSPSEAELEHAGGFGFNGKLKDYFHPITLNEIVAARTFFLTKGVDDPETRLVHACLQHILHGNRPYALSRNSHPITPYAPSGPIEYRGLMERLRAKVRRSLAVDLGANFMQGKAFLADCTSAWPSAIGLVDAIITSPPFYDSTRFYAANWMRLWFSGWEPQDFRTKPTAFVDERQKLGFDVYRAIFSQASSHLTAGGVVVMHLGKSRKCDMAEAITAVAAAENFRVLDHFSESVAHCESHGIKDKGTVTSHEYLVLSR